MAEAGYKIVVIWHQQFVDKTQLLGPTPEFLIQ